jgi:cephalosporin hydroxylase
MKSNEPVLLLLRAAHTRQHMVAESETYRSLVTRGSLVVAKYDIMEGLVRCAARQARVGLRQPVCGCHQFCPGTSRIRC